MKIQIDQSAIITLIVIIGIIKSILIFWKLKMPNKGIIFISIVLFFFNIILSANVGFLIFNETLKLSIQYGKLNANIISISFGIIGFISTHIVMKKIVDFIYYKLGYNMNKK